MKLIDKLTQGLPKKHKPKRAVKGLVARNFYIDGNLFIEKFDQVKNTESMQMRNFRAKAIVDLTMSIECSLKSIILSLSKDNELPSDAYKKARKCSHNLDKLYAEAILRAKNRFLFPPKKQALFDDLKSLGVGSRYSYEIWSLQFNSQAGTIFLGENIISRTIDDIKWANNLRDVAVLLNNISNNCYYKFLSKHCTLYGNKNNTYEKHLNLFLDEIK
ncbi:hypothetical protein [Iodobacter fluviatilis]|uniref:Uncharacterized protein n=1 Tax=Iodobacter fluviatilis TaxID=537 RepID=A0A377Q3C3_9NEIS|nr:hypothetical protein [Iodobacter fluviatilis]TCU90280.1 hypothetical protein EV682_101305 [Iodobacter fluviatilis]STQ89307.1 Uncharacterised protein [Iodobacter fluviatilis]